MLHYGALSPNPSTFLDVNMAGCKGKIKFYPSRKLYFEHPLQPVPSSNPARPQAADHSELVGHSRLQRLRIDIARVQHAVVAHIGAGRFADGQRRPRLHRSSPVVAAGRAQRTEAARGRRKVVGVARSTRQGMGVCYRSSNNPPQGH